MKRFLILRLGLSFIAALFALSACMGAPPMAQPTRLPDLDFGALNEDDGEGDKEAPRTPPQPGLGGHLHVPMSLPATLNPLLNSDPHVAAVLRLIFEPLVIFDAEKRPIPNPAITESIIFSPYGHSLTLTLQNNIFWEDGSAITTADVAFSIDVLTRNAPETAVYRSLAASISSHSVIDSRSILINLNSSNWSAKYALAFPIIPADYYRTTSMTNLRAARNMHPLGNGPFRFHSYEEASRLELIINHAAIGGRPYIQRVTAIVLRDMEASAAHAFEQGIVDVFAGSPAYWGRFSALGKNRVAEAISGDFDFIGFNFNRGIFADFEIRAAVAHSFDAEAILQRYFNQNNAALAPVHPQSWLAVGGLASYAFNTNRAEELFMQAGFSHGVDGFLERQLSEILPPQRLLITILVNSYNPIGLSIADTLSQGLSDAGVDTNLVSLPFFQFIQRVEAGDFDIIVGGLSLSGPPNFGFLSAKSQRDSLAESIFGHSSEQLDLILSMINYAPAETAYRQAVGALQQYIADNLPFIGVAFRQNALYTTGRVHGDFQPIVNNILADIANWFLAD